MAGGLSEGAERKRSRARERVWCLVVSSPNRQSRLSQTYASGDTWSSLFEKVNGWFTLASLLRRIDAALYIFLMRHESLAITTAYFETLKVSTFTVFHRVLDVFNLL